MLYDPGKDNVVVDGLSNLCIGSVFLTLELFLRTCRRGDIVYNRYKSFFLAEVKEN